MENTYILILENIQYFVSHHERCMERKKWVGRVPEKKTERGGRGNKEEREGEMNKGGDRRKE